MWFLFLLKRKKNKKKKIEKIEKRHKILSAIKPQAANNKNQKKFMKYWTNIDERIKVGHEQKLYCI